MLKKWFIGHTLDYTSRTLSYAYQDSAYDDDENLISPFANPFYADDYPYTEGEEF